MKLLPGAKVGRWTLISDGHRTHGMPAWECRCDCGTKRMVRAARLSGGYTNSCGCICSDRMKSINTKHGLTGTPLMYLYATWRNMLKRCEDNNSKDYGRYGGRGITVCDRWHDFSKFVEDMHPRPEGRSLDRINNDGPYSPSNVRWATAEEQANNRSNRFRRKRNALTGVRRRGNRWAAVLWNGNREVWVGRFDSPAAAAEAYLKALQECDGVAANEA